MSQMPSWNRVQKFLITQKHWVFKKGGFPFWLWLYEIVIKHWIRRALVVAGRTNEEGGGGEGLSRMMAEGCT